MAVIYIIYLSCVAKKCIQIKLFAQRSIVNITYIALAELILHKLNMFRLLCQCPQNILLWSFHCRQGVWALLALLGAHCVVDSFWDILWDTSLYLKKRWLLTNLNPFGMLFCFQVILHLHGWNTEEHNTCPLSHRKSSSFIRRLTCS